MQKIFITATNTDIGKTFTTLKLMQRYAKEGYKVAALKPIETGVDKFPPDGMKLLTLSQNLNPNLKNITMEDVVPITFELPAAPFIASQVQKIDLDPIYKSIQKLQPLCDVLFIEGAGGLYVPINKDYFMINLIEDLHVNKTILVTHCDLGCINDTLLSKHSLDQKKIQNEVYFNCKNGRENFEKVSKPFFDAIDFKINFV